LKTLKEAHPILLLPGGFIYTAREREREREALVYLVFKLPVAIAKNDLRTKKTLIQN
jgi:hypothetical protein